MPSNKATINLIIGTLAVLALLCIATVCLMSYRGVMIPPELNTLAGGLVGTLGAMLVKTSPTETAKKIEVSDQPVITTTEGKTNESIGNTSGTNYSSGFGLGS